MNFEAWADAVEGRAPYRFTTEQLLANIRILDGSPARQRRAECRLRRESWVAGGPRNSPQARVDRR